MYKAVFFDRDGVINRNPNEGDYIQELDEIEILPGVRGVVSKLKESGFKIVIVTNQRGIARGQLSKDMLEKIHNGIQEKLSGKNGKLIDGFYYCPHNIGECDCRKPEPGLILKAKDDLDIDLNSSWLVGDRETDRLAAQNAGIPKNQIIMVQTNGNLNEVLGEITNE